MSANKVLKIILFICAISGLSVHAHAQYRIDSTVVQKFRISYPVNDTELHENYHENQSALRSIRDHFKKSPRIDSIVIFSYSSPEGPYKLNKRLAEERGNRAREYLLAHMPAERHFPDSMIIIRPTAENWEGLYEMVSESYPYSDKQDVLDLLNRTDLHPDTKKARLKKLNNGGPWEYIKTNILPQLRFATWVAEWVHVIETMEDIPAVAGIEPDIKLQSPSADIAEREVIVAEEPSESSKTILALKTNLLYDIISFLNFSIEVPLYKDRLSFLYYHQFPWWTWGQADNEYCARFLSIGGEARLWFQYPEKKQKFNGHFLGLYAESGKYDFEWQRNICYQGEFYSTGLSYGYAMPIGRKDKLNLEFSLSVGYASIAYRGYTPSADYEILWRDPNKVGRLHYFGPTKAQVSLVIPIRVKTKGGNEL